MKLLVFSRRSLQARIDAMASWLDPKSLDSLCSKLDRRGAVRLSTMWEVVWLHALGEMAKVDHEQPLPDGSKPDFCFQLPFQGGLLQVVGDVTTVSDRGVHENNPVRQFSDELSRLVRKVGLDPNHFRLDVGHRVEGEFPDTRNVLQLPLRSSLQSFMRAHVVPFLKELASTRPAIGKREIATEDAKVTLSYNTGQEFAGSGHVSYTHFTSAFRNPVHTQLKKKERQLRNAPDAALRVVVLCDAGCQAMQKDVFGTGWSADKVAGEFLRTSKAIDVVILVSVEIHNPMDLHNRYYSLNARIAVPTSATGAPRRTRESIAAARAHFDQALKHLPTPVLDPHNASLRLDLPSPGAGTLGIGMNDQCVRLSARLLLDLLAGKINDEEFQRAYHWHPKSDPRHPNAFALKHGRGQLITSVSVTSGGDQDDDWIEFSFGPPDPAGEPFRRPG